MISASCENTWLFFRARDSSARKFTSECLRTSGFQTLPHNSPDSISQQRLWADSENCVCLLRACADSNFLSEGRRIHHHIIRSGEERKQVLANILVEMYGKCDALEESHYVFENMHQRNVFSWTIIIAAYSQHGKSQEALQLYRQMLKERVKPDKVTFVGILNVCTSLMDLAHGNDIHASIVCLGLDSHVVIRTAIVNMYGKCGSIDNARAVFDHLDGRDVVLWNAMMTAYTQHGYGEETFRLYQQMQCEGLKANEITFVNVLGACGILAMLARGKEIHSCVINCGYGSRIIVGTALINMYRKNGSLQDAWNTFDKIPQRDVVLWNTMIVTFTEHGQDSDALTLFEQMQKQEVRPNQITFLSILNAIVSPATLAQGKEIHASVDQHGFESDAVMGTALINMYYRCGSLEDAKGVFCKMQVRNVASWTAMIAAYVQHWHGKDAFELYQQMLTEGVKPDELTFGTILDAYSCPSALGDGREIHLTIVESGVDRDFELQTALITMYGKCGSVEDALKVYDKDHCQSVAIWNAMMAVYTQHGHTKEAMCLYQHMQGEGMKPNESMFITILGACCNLVALAEGREVHACLINAGCESDIILETSLVNLYSKCGSLKDARQVFNTMCTKTTISWNAIISGYAENGEGNKAVQLFEQMQLEGLKPDEATLTNIFCACSHAGLMDEALWYFAIMNEICNIMPTAEHYACMIDLLGRIGRLNDAEDLMNRMPFQPDIVTWRSLLGACRVHGDMELGRRTAECVVQLFPDKTAPYVLLSNILSSKWN